MHRFGEGGREWAFWSLSMFVAQCHWLRMKAGSTGGAIEPGHGHLGSSREEGDGRGLLRPGN